MQVLRRDIIFFSYPQCQYTLHTILLCFVGLADSTIQACVCTYVTGIIVGALSIDLLHRAQLLIHHLSLGGIASGSLSVEDMLQSGGLDISFSPELSVFGLLLTHTHSLTGTPEVPDLSLTMYLSQLECSMQVWAVR